MGHTFTVFFFLFFCAPQTICLSFLYYVARPQHIVDTITSRLLTRTGADDLCFLMDTPNIFAGQWFWATTSVRKKSNFAESSLLWSNRCAKVDNYPPISAINIILLALVDDLTVYSIIGLNFELHKSLPWMLLLRLPAAVRHRRRNVRFKYPSNTSNNPSSIA